MTKLYQTKRWKDARKAFIKGQSCNWNPLHEGILVLDHTTYTNQDGSSMTDDQLLNFERLYLEGGLLVLCKRCAFARRYNKVLCNKCGINYHGKRYDQCFNCLKNENPEAFKLCEECGINFHDKKYPRCAPCSNKKKRSKSASKGWKTRRDQGRKR